MKILREVSPRAVHSWGREVARKLRKLSTVQSRDRLLLETQRAIVREIHARFTERADRGDTGMRAALDGLDTMWAAVRHLHPGADSVVETLAQGPGGSLGPHTRLFAEESTARLEDAIARVLGSDAPRLVVPPRRLAVLVRIVIEGFLVELARAETPEDLAEVDRAYQDLRDLFARDMLSAKVPSAEARSADAVPLPW